MAFLDYLQKLPLSLMLVATLSIAIVAGWIIIGVVRLCVYLSSRDHGKSPYIPELVTITSILFALILSFSAAGVWNAWVQAQTAVRGEALALDTVLAWAGGLGADGGARVRGGVIAYARAAAEHEWPAMSRRAGADAPSFDVSERILSILTAD